VKYTVEWSKEDQVYVGYCAECPSLAAHGRSQSEALAEIKQVVEFCLTDELMEAVEFVLMEGCRAEGWDRMAEVWQKLDEYDEYNKG